MQRTQIYLPEQLREEIDRFRQAHGETLATYLRRAARERVEQDKKRKVNLKKLADEVTSGVKKSGWEGVDIDKWQREIRRDRKII